MSLAYYPSTGLIIGKLQIISLWLLSFIALGCLLLGTFATLQDFKLKEGNED